MQNSHYDVMLFRPSPTSRFDHAGDDYDDDIDIVIMGMEKRISV